MFESENGKNVNEEGGKRYNLWETPEKSQGQWSTDG